MSVDLNYCRALCDAGISGDLALRIAALPQESEFYDPERLLGIVGSLAKLCHALLLEIDDLRHYGDNNETPTMPAT